MKLIKSILISIPVLVIAATVGLGTVGCGDDNGEPDLAMNPDQAVNQPIDMSKKD